MTACFPTEMFNQRLVGGTDTSSSADLIFHFPLVSHIYHEDEEGEAGT